MDPNNDSEAGETLLHWAVFEGKEDIVQMLLENTIDPNLQGKRGQTPLHRAVQKDQLTVINYFYNACQHRYSR